MAKTDLLINIAVKNQQALGSINNQLTRMSSSVTGSTEEGAEAFRFISEFATQTQFGVDDLTKTFIKLKSAGIEPTKELLTTFTDAAAVTNDQIGSLEAVTDLFARTVKGGLGLEEIQRLGDRGIPVLAILEEKLGLSRAEISEFGKTTEGAAAITKAFAEGINERFGGATQKLVSNLSTEFSNAKIALQGVADEFGQGISPALKDAVGGFTALVNENRETISALGELTGFALKALISGLNLVLKAIGNVIDFFKDFVGTVKDTIQAVKDFKNDVVNQFENMKKGIGDKMSNVGDSIVGGFQDIYNKVVGNSIVPDMVDDVGKEMDRLAFNADRSLGTYSDAVQENIDNDVILQALHRTIGEGFTPLEGKITAVAAGMSAFKDTASSALTDVIMGTKSLRDALGEIVNSTLRALIQGFIDGADESKLTDQLNRELKVEIALRSILAMFGGGGFGIPFFADGGRTTANQPIIVGERGPELFVPNTSGTVVANDELGVNRGNASMGGGDDINVTFNINTLDASDFDSLLTTRQDLIIGLINRGLAERGKRSLTA